MAAADFERYFLDADDTGDLFFRAPRRRNCTVEPLVDRAPAFEAMEREVLGATTSVNLTGWVFLPTAPLLDRGVRKASGGRTWLDLIRHVVRKPGAATVRIIITDFDPFFEAGNHRLCWSALKALIAVRDRLPVADRDRLQLIGSLHEYFITPGLATLGLFSMKDQISAVVADYNAMPTARARRLFARTPGHWSSITVTAKGRFAVAASPQTRAFLASHHQKSCVVDGRVGFVGGMDLTPLALDDRRHRQRRHPFRRKEPDLSWHDVHSRVEGAVVQDLERNFGERWNSEALVFTRRLTDFAAVAPSGAKLPSPTSTPLPRPSLPTTSPPPGRSVAQVLRTVSVEGGGFLPELRRSDVLEAYTAAIDGARHYVYVENQYVRSSEIVDALIARHTANPALQVIVVIPIAPEELTSLTAADPKALHPVAVQIEQLERLEAAVGANLGVFSLVLRTRSSKKVFTDAFGSPQLYVHSKICIVDDEWATIGSANVNGRSFRMDTELNIGWVDPTAVTKFRLDLWRHLLGHHAHDVAHWVPSLFVVRWKAAAALNSVQPPATRGGLVVPHDIRLLKGAATKMPLVPEVFIRIEDTLPEPAAADLLEQDETQDEPAAVT